MCLFICLPIFYIYLSIHGSIYLSVCIYILATNHLSTHTGVELELVESMPLLEWLANNYKGFGAGLEIITDRSQEGAQFVKGFGGIGGALVL